MKVAYLFESTNAREILENMIIPQMEKGIHGADVVGMMFFFDNCYMLVEGNDIADRLSALAEKTGMTKKDAIKAAARDRGVPKNEVYQQVLDD